MLRILFILISLLFFVSCVPGHYFSTGGSRSDGTVEFACNYDMFTTCDPREIVGSVRSEAAQVCRNWGYESAQSFGGVGNRPGFQGKGQMYIVYQCTGDLEK